MINLIASVFEYKNKLAIGNETNNLLFKLPEDMTFFRKITTNSLSIDSKLKYNVLVMGNNTYKSLGTKLLKNRINIVLSKSKNTTNIKKITEQGVYYLDLDQFLKFYQLFNPNVFVIGGAFIYNLFLSHPTLKPTKVYLTHVQKTNPKFVLNINPTIFMDHLPESYHLIGYSQQYHSSDNSVLKDPEQNLTRCKGGGQTILKYRVLYYVLKTDVYHEEYHYFGLLRKILGKGNDRSDRTGTGTRSLFGTGMRFDISETIPLMTTRSTPFKMILEELLWMTRGDTDAKILQKKGIHIWNGNTSREFLDSRGLNHYPEGVLGAGYGHQMRFSGSEYSPENADTSKVDTSRIGGFDQLKYVEDLLKNDPFSRRILMNYWNPSDLNKMALVPCHMMVQFYVQEIDGIKYLSSQLYQRSSDSIALSFNVVFYTVLTHILSKKCGMKPKEFTHIIGDSHIYKNNIDAVQEQLTRTPIPFPKLKMSDDIINKDWKDMTVDDFELIGYFSHKNIPMKMAV
jgi:thymidylate synthase